MTTRVRLADPLAQGAEGLIVACFEGETPDTFAKRTVDQALSGLMRDVVATGDFKGKPGQCLVLRGTGATAGRVALVGLGKKADVTLETYRCAAGQGTRALRDAGAKSVGLLLDGQDRGSFSDEEVAQAVAEGALLSLYRMDDYRTRDRESLKTVDELQFWAAGEFDTAAAERGLETARVLAESMEFARHLVMHPANVATPGYLASASQALAGEVGLTVRVMDKPELEERGFRTLLAVNRASEDVEPARLIVLEWNGGEPGEPPIAIVGKAVTFDSGGISIKPSEGMEMMKFDMAGGAATIAILRAAAALKLKRNIVGLVPATENMVGGAALKPGDVITTYGGLTVEINNTDAEGRLILADALAYAVKDLKAAAVVDMATLTGACLIALGHVATGVMGNHPELTKRVLDSGERTGERGWPLPLWPEYASLVDSDIADMKNSGGRYAGTISAGYFLGRFVGETPWVHLDVAGTAWTEKDLPYLPKGPTGAPVRMMIDLLRQWQPLETAKATAL